ncbi:MAG: RidA family protein [Longimicrobiales bacterium]
MREKSGGEARRRVATAAPWAGVVGYSRAVRAGDRVWVSGTAAVGEDGRIVSGGAYAQAMRCFEIIRDALEAAGAGLEHVVRTRMYIGDAKDWEAVGRAHGEFLGAVLPATTMIVTRFIDEAMLVEIEAEAVVE